MRLSIFIASLAFLAMGLAPPSFGQCGFKQTEMLYTIVRVDTGSGNGSGIVVYSGKLESADDHYDTYILTNNHVIASAVKIVDEWNSTKGEKVQKERRLPVTVNWFDYNKCSRHVGTRGRTADIVHYDAAADLAVLKIRDREGRVPYVARMISENATINLGDPVWAAGAGLGEPPFITFGHVAFLDKQIEGYRYMLASAPIIFGNSGGALFRERDGQFDLIGVTSKMSGSQFSGAVSHMGWSIPMETVRVFLREAKLFFITDTPPAPPVAPVATVTN